MSAFVVNQAVAPEDIDGYGHVNNVQYHRYAQTARVAYFDALGLPDDSFTIVVANGCRYLKQVYYPDTLTISVHIKAIGTTSVTHEYVFFSERQQAVVAIASAVMVVMDKKSQTKRPISDQEKQDMLAITAPHTQPRSAQSLTAH